MAKRTWRVTNPVIHYPPSRMAVEGDLVTDIPATVAKAWEADGVIEVVSGDEPVIVAPSTEEQL